MKLRSTLLFAAALASLSACASHDAQDEYIFGESTRNNIAVQAIRPVDAPNTALVEGESSDRAVTAVKRLREGKPTELRDSTPSGTGAG